MFAAVMFFLLSCSCKAQPDSPSELSYGDGSLCIATWNVQNVFDDVEDGTEYEEYTAASGWDGDAFERRLGELSGVVSRLPSCTDYVIVLNEVENPNVVSRLASCIGPAGRETPWFAFAKAPGGSVGLAVVSSMPVLSAKVHGVGDGLRPVLEVNVQTPGGVVSVLAVHMKSNIGGVEQTSSLRRLAGETASQVASSILRENPGRLILLCGDFNEELWDENSMGRGLDSQAPLKVSGSFERGMWYNPWLDPAFSSWPGGSYCYQGLWKCYDNILVSSSGGDGYGYELEAAGVVFSGSIKGADGRPNAWNRDLLKGVSDHLPVWTVFRLE